MGDFEWPSASFIKCEYDFVAIWYSDIGQKEMYWCAETCVCAKMVPVSDAKNRLIIVYSHTVVNVLLNPLIH